VEALSASFFVVVTIISALKITLARHYYRIIVFHFDFIIYFLCFWKNFEICVGPWNHTDVDAR
jgi:hypothetical protein